MVAFGFLGRVPGAGAGNCIAFASARRGIALLRIRSEWDCGAFLYKKIRGIWCAGVLFLGFVGFGLVVFVFCFFLGWPLVQAFLLRSQELGRSSILGLLAVDRCGE